MAGCDCAHVIRMSVKREKKIFAGVGGLRRGRAKDPRDLEISEFRQMIGRGYWLALQAFRDVIPKVAFMSCPSL